MLIACKSNASVIGVCARISLYLMMSVDCTLLGFELVIAILIERLVAQDSF